MSFADDLAFIDPNTIEQNGPKYVMGHWHNGDTKLAALGKTHVAYTGGVFVPEKYLDDDLALAPGWAKIELTFSGGNTDRGIACSAPMLAVIRTRFAWFERQGQVTTYYPRSEYRAGLRGKLQALCAVQGYDFPVVFTFTGTAGKEFEKHVRDYTAKVRDAARRIIGNKTEFPRFAFYMPVKAGAHVKAGQQGKDSLVTPPTVTVATITPDDLSKFYVGRERLVLLQAEYHKADEWVAAWNQGKQPDAEVTPADQPEPEGDGYYPDDADLQDIGAVRAPINPVQATFGAGNPPKRPSQYTQGR